MKKRIAGILLAVLILLTLPFGGGYASPAQSRSSHFCKAFVLTGDPARDICTVAASQIGSSRASLGYTEAWCADFVSDCARLAKVPESVIPSDSSCENMYRIMTENGAVRVSEARAGDLVFYYGTNKKTGEYRFFHVGIMTGPTLSVQGNVGGGDGKVRINMKPDSLKNTKYDWSYLYLRPNYTGTIRTNSVYFKSLSAEDISETGARLRAKCGYTAERPSRIVCCVGSSPNRLTALDKVLTVSVYDDPFPVSFDAAKLTPGTTYYYKLCAVTDKQIYVSELSSFRTAGRSGLFATLLDAFDAYFDAVGENFDFSETA